VAAKKKQPAKTKSPPKKKSAASRKPSKKIEVAKRSESKPSALTNNVPADVVVGLDELTGWLGVSKQWVRHLANDGYVEKTSRNTYPLRKAVLGYISFLKDENRRKNKSAAAVRVQEARAEQIEVRTARELRQLIPREEAEALLQLVVGRLISELNGVPAQVTRDLNERAKIEAAIDGIRSKVAKQLADIERGYAELGDVDPSGAEGAAGSMGESE
jgi:phage terminase Nu1 subunit (DNA packaging protein)